MVIRFVINQHLSGQFVVQHRSKHNCDYIPYMVLSNIINPLTKLKFLSIIKFIAKKKAAPIVRPLYFVGMGRLEPLV